MLKCMVLQGASYIYNISRLRVKIGKAEIKKAMPSDSPHLPFF
jgi:hypothetical protein